jgi:polar amino acid transport system permease protein
MFNEVSLELLVGFAQNCMIFAVTLVLALPLGLVVTFAEISRVRLIRWTARGLVWLIRGTPLMLQLFVVFYVPGLIFGLPFQSRLVAVMIAFVINYAAYFAEIYRGAITNIPKGQYEAGQVLGLTSCQIFFSIILLQMVQRSITPISNEVISLIKDTSLARVLAVPEILMQATEYTTRGLIWPLFYSGLFYLVATAAITVVFNRLERRLAYVGG